MGSSTGRDLHVDRNLTNVAINYRPQTMIADMIAPIVPVEKETDQFPVFSRFEAYSVPDTIRARGTEAKKITRSVSSMNYAVKNYALGYDVTIEDRANMDAAYAYELGAGATRFLLGKLYLDWEKRLLTKINTTSAVSTTFVPNSAWNAPGANAGDPIEAIFKAIEQFKSNVGVSPNRILAGWRANNAMLRNPHVRNFIKGSNNGGGLVTREQLRQLFEMDSYLVSDVFYTTQNEAVGMAGANPTLTSPIHDRVYLYYAPSAPSRDDPSWMYSFRWQNPLLPAPLVVERHPYDSRKKVETIEAGYYQAEVITGADYACVIAGVNSAQSGGI